MGKTIRCSKEISASMKEDKYTKVVIPPYFSFAFSNKESIDLAKMPWLNPQKIDTKNAFHSCFNLKSVNIQGFDNLDSKDMSYMFFNCNKLKNLDLRDLRTDGVVDMSNMFRGCSNLQSINFGTGFDTLKVTDMSYMFSNCSKLTSLDVSKFDTSNVTNMMHTFLGCGSLRELDLSEWNVRKVTQFGNTLISKTGMFHGCRNLVTIKFGKNFEPPTDANFAGMFRDCMNLQLIDLSSWGYLKTSIDKYEAMFKNCSALTEIKGSYIISFSSTSKSSSLNEMFYGCRALTSLDLRSLIRSDSQSLILKNTFAGCLSLKHLDISNIAGKNTTITGAFTDVPDDCEILVNDEVMKTKIETAYSNLTNVKVKGA